MEDNEEIDESYHIHYYNSGTNISIKSEEGCTYVTIRTQSYGDMSAKISFAVSKEDLAALEDLFNKAYMKA